MPSQPTPSARDLVIDGLDWRLIGPHRGGRVVAVAGDPRDPMTFYFGACAGGVWKTTDGGRFWRNVSDGYFTTAAVGAIAVAPSDPNVIYAGTGETCVRNQVSHGDGLYKSTDGGRTWRNVGLTDTRHIGKIQIHPHDPDTVYVAALGHAFGPNEERGVFRSRDGGETWEKVLYRSPRAGSHDISLDPNDPNGIFAAVGQVQRYPHTLVSGGEECGLWRSTDAGDSWVELSRNPGLPQGLLGKIGVAVSPALRGRVWALIEAEDGALFRSDDGGESWIRLSEESLLRTRPWYYMHVTADPVDPDTVYVQDYSHWKSVDAGATVERMPTPHGDEHALWIDPSDNRRMIKGNDGGACVTFNGGQSWSSIYNQPTAQLYHVTTDDQVPYRVYGSQQDNTAISIPSMSVDGSIHQREWFSPGGGESGYIAVKPDDHNIVVASGPAGRRWYNDLMTTYDHRTGQAWNTTVWPELYGWGVGAGDLKYRFYWTFPIHFSLHDPNLLYVAGNRLFSSTDLGASWEAISPDLTRNDPDKLGPSGGPITRDNTGAEVYCVIFALAESPLRAGLLWAGTDDGLVHVSTDGSRTWSDVTPPDLPEWALISIVEASPHDADTAYVAATRYKLDDNRPYLFKTTDRGGTWTAITTGIPDHEFTRVIREDPNRRGLLYAGTETGIYVSFDDGRQWQRLGGNLPVAPVYDLVIKGVEMVVATHGRSFWILDDVTLLHQLADGDGDGTRLFKPRSTRRMRTAALARYGMMDSRLLPGTVEWGHSDTSQVAYERVRGSDGEVSYQLLDAGTNPPRGVVIRYYLASEPAGPVTLSLLDAEGREVRSFTSEPSEGADARAPRVPAKAGLNRFLWSTRATGVPPVRVEGTNLQAWERPEGPMVLPGTYQVRLTVDGTELTQSFELDPDPRVSTSTEALQEQFDLLVAIRDALSVVNGSINRIVRLLPQVRTWEERSAEGNGAEPVHSAAGELRAELEAILGRLIDVNIKQSQLWPSGLHEKLNALFESVDTADKAPPRQAREVFAKLTSELDELVQRLDKATSGGVSALDAAIRSAGMQVVG